MLLRALLVLATACGACDGDERGRRTGRRIAIPEPEQPEAPPPPAPDPLYDEEGELLEGEELVAGLRLPRGLTLLHQYERRRVYRSRAPAPKLLGYFGPRLFTGEVERRGEGALYKHARPLAQRGAEVFLDVAIVPRGHETRVRIEEYPPPPPETSPASELVRRYNEQLRRLD